MFRGSGSRGQPRAKDIWLPLKENIETPPASQGAGGRRPWAQTSLPAFGVEGLGRPASWGHCAAWNARHSPGCRPPVSQRPALLLVSGACPLTSGRPSPLTPSPPAPTKGPSRGSWACGGRVTPHKTHPYERLPECPAREPGRPGAPPAPRHVQLGGCGDRGPLYLCTGPEDVGGPSLQDRCFLGQRSPAFIYSP